MQPKKAVAGERRRTALITGASAGIGAEFSRQLAAQGLDVVLVARRRERLLELAAELKRRYAVSASVIRCDLADPNAAKYIVSRLHTEGTHIDYLVNNAGYGVPGKFNSSEWQSHADFLAVLVTVVTELTYLLLPAMQAKQWGRVINVASVAALVPGSAGHTLYAASKAFLVKFSESLAMENHESGVHVIALCPGFTYSEFHDVTGTREQVSKLPKRMWMDAADVVRSGILAIEQKQPLPVVIPGAYYKRIAILTRLLPQGLMLRYMRRRAKDFRDTR
jgi:short-subunit dehydrogenase